jgi:hypothetical protein
MMGTSSTDHEKMGEVIVASPVEVKSGSIETEVVTKQTQ